jgi:hypothetical protein
MRHGCKQIVFRADGFAEMLYLLDGTPRKITFDLVFAPWSPEILAESIVKAALSSWVEREVPPPWIGWEELEEVLLRQGIDVDKLIAMYPPYSDGAGGEPAHPLFQEPHGRYSRPS